MKNEKLIESIIALSISHWNCRKFRKNSHKRRTMPPPMDHIRDELAKFDRKQLLSIKKIVGDLMLLIQAEVIFRDINEGHKEK